MDEADEIKKAMQRKKMLIGKESVLRAIKKGQIEKVILSANYPEKEETKRLCNVGQIAVIESKLTNEEIAALCKKPFNISAVGIKK
jgi:ribosomal protein L30E